MYKIARIHSFIITVTILLLFSISAQAQWKSKFVPREFASEIIPQAPASQWQEVQLDDFDGTVFAKAPSAIADLQATSGKNQVFAKVQSSKTPGDSVRVLFVVYDNVEISEEYKEIYKYRFEQDSILPSAWIHGTGISFSEFQTGLSSFGAGIEGIFISYLEDENTYNYIEGLRNNADFIVIVAEGGTRTAFAAFEYGVACLPDWKLAPEAKTFNHELSHLFGLHHSDAEVNPETGKESIVSASAPLRDFFLSSKGKQLYAEFFGLDKIAPMLQSISASQTIVNEGDSVTFYADDLIGVVPDWEWSINGSPISNSDTLVYTFETPGTYSVTLRVANTNGSVTSKTLDITVNRIPVPPVASYIASKTNPKIGEEITFTATDTNTTAWQWNIPNATPNSSNKQSISVVFNASGEQAVNLSCINMDGKADTTFTINVRELVLPTAGVAATSKDLFVGEETVFVGTGGSNSKEWITFFGDGDSATTQNCSHIYSLAGIYTVTRIERNEDGADTLTLPDYITVKEIESPEQIYPMNNDVISIDTNLVWSSDNDTRAYYLVEVSDNENFSNLLINQTTSDTTIEAVSLNLSTKYWWRLKTIIADTLFGSYSNTLSFTTSEITGVNSQTDLPTEFSLGQNYPNPFNPETTISYSIAKAGLVKIEIYNSLGQSVKTLVNSVKSIGNYKVKFDASEIPSGVYFYRITADSFVNTKKMLLLR